MFFRLLADAVFALHLGFIAFAVAGALCVLRRPRLVWLHVPAAVWAVWIELTGWICPLTPLENHLRARAGQQGYEGGFIEHYLLPVIYPGGLTPKVQVVLGTTILAVNLFAYGVLLRRLLRGS